jgi:hypothetical protein
MIITAKPGTCPPTEAIGSILPSRKIVIPGSYGRKDTHPAN